jgi:hypothetical protein
MKPKLSADKSTLTVHVPMKLQRHGGRKLIIAPDGGELQYAAPVRDSTLIKGIARAHRWRRLLENGVYLSISELAKAEKINLSYLSHVLRLTLLAPDIIETILDGHHPKGLKLTDLLKPFPMEWHRQREKFGFRVPDTKNV